MIQAVVPHFVLPLILLGNLITGSISPETNWACQRDPQDLHIIVCRSDYGAVPVWVTIVRSPLDSEIKQSLDEWRAWGNAHSDTYIFAINDPGDARLILSFSTNQDGIEQANIFINNLGHLPVSYSINKGMVSLRTEDDFPYLVMSTDHGSWVENGLTNYNLSIDIDGILPGFGSSEAKTDGIVDTEILVGGGVDGAGWETRSLLNDLQPSWWYPRFVAHQVMDPSSDFLIQGSLIQQFPYFCLGSESINWFIENPCPLYFDLKLEEFRVLPFPGFQNGGIYSINSPAAPPNVNFEAPFVFYDLDPKNRYAELAIRVSHFKATDLVFTDDEYAILNDIRYSWKLDDPTRWRYALQLGGLHDYEKFVNIAGVDVWGVEGKELPEWVMDKVWPLTMFVEAEEGYPGSEGIYFYSTETYQAWDWLFGLIDEMPEYLQSPILTDTLDLEDNSRYTLPKSIRGEYSANYQTLPKLYFSSLDGRLHLVNASGGTLNVGDGFTLRFHNLGNGRYINGWTREQVSVDQDGNPINKVLESLYFIEKSIIYSGSGFVEIHQTNIAPAAFEISPPIDSSSWTNFKDLINQYQLDGGKSPGSLYNWLRNFQGDSIHIDSAKLEDIQIEPGGFRMNLELFQDFQIADNEQYQLPKDGLTPGRYSVKYNGSTFQVDPMIPPNLELTIAVQEADPVTYVGLYQVKLVAANQGLDESLALQAILQADCGSQPLELLRETVSVPGRSQKGWLLSWQPQPLRSCRLSAALYDPGGLPVVQTGVDFTRPGPSSDSAGSIVFNSTQSFHLLLAFGLLILLGSAAGWVFSRLGWRSPVSIKEP